MLERVSNCLGTIPASIFERKWLMWLLTMPSLATSCSAISVPDRPMTMSESNSGSLGVSPSGATVRLSAVSGRRAAMASTRRRFTAVDHGMIVENMLENLFDIGEAPVRHGSCSRETRRIVEPRRPTWRLMT